MQEKGLTINDLIVSVQEAMREGGYSISAVYAKYGHWFNVISTYYRKIGRIYHESDVTAECVALQAERKERGEISDHYFRHLGYAAHRLDEYFMTEKIRIINVMHSTKFVLNEQNERLVDQFVIWKKYGENTVNDAIWVVRRYLDYFEQKGYNSLETVSIEDVRQYILSTAAELEISSLYNILLYLKNFHIFLKEKGFPAPDCVELLSYKGYREMPIQSYVTDEELNAVLSQIDANNPMGKRDLAMIFLAATTGMRACDIIRHKLSDIDWRKGELRLVQKKTGNTMRLPLIANSGKALQDYILTARPASDCPEVFLSAKAPTRALMDAVSVGDMFMRYQKKVGIRRTPFDGKGFHGLRRRFAKKMIVAGTPLTTVSQILGHTDIHSVRQYLSLDIRNLKECALDFRGIEVTREALI